jgi:hypothetical protein
MTDIVERLRMTANCGIPDFTNSKLLDEAADEIERLRSIADTTDIMTEQAIKRQNDEIERLREFGATANPGGIYEGLPFEAADEIERLRAVITRAKDALLDGQSTQWVHDLLVAALVGPKP